MCYTTGLKWCLSAMVLAASAGVIGCAPPPASTRGFNSDDPGAKLYAIVRAGQVKDHSAIPHLIEQLSSDDQAVRMYAISALDRITGTRLGYVYYAPPAERHRAVERWVQAYENGRFESDTTSTAASEP